MREKGKKEGWLESRRLGEEEQKYIPEDLRGLVEALDAIPRYKHPGYPKGVFVESVKQHVISGHRLMDWLEENGYYQFSGEARRGWTVHDIGELKAGDITAVEKEQSPILAAFAESAERAANAELLYPADRKLVEEFEAAGGFLKGKASFTAGMEEWIILQLIDKIDGNVRFHEMLTGWLIDHAEIEKYPPGEALEYTFKKTGEYQARLMKAADGEWCKLSLEMLGWQIEYVKGLWSRVPEKLIPDQIAAYV